MNINFNKVLEQEKSKEELLDVIYKQRLMIQDLQLELDTEREQVQDIMDNVMPIVEEIKNSNKWLRFIKIVKLAFVLVEYFTKFFKARQDKVDKV